jgi:hypothetical protein
MSSPPWSLTRASPSLPESNRSPQPSWMGRSAGWRLMLISQTRCCVSRVSASPGVEVSFTMPAGVRSRCDFPGVSKSHVAKFPEPSNTTPPYSVTTARDQNSVIKSGGGRCFKACGKVAQASTCDRRPDHGAATGSLADGLNPGFEIGAGVADFDPGFQISAGVAEPSLDASNGDMSCRPRVMVGKFSSESVEATSPESAPSILMLSSSRCLWR